MSAFPKKVDPQFLILLGVYTLMILFFCGITNDGLMFFVFVLLWIITILLLDRLDKGDPDLRGDLNEREVVEG